jgi:hypothetical protein
MVDSLPKWQKCQSRNLTKNGNIICGFDKKVWAVCPEASRLPVTVSGDRVELKCTSKDIRLSKRRANEQTEEFRSVMPCVLALRARTLGWLEKPGPSDRGTGGFLKLNCLVPLRL